MNYTWDLHHIWMINVYGLHGHNRLYLGKSESGEYIHGNKRNKVPNWMRSLFLQRMGRLCCVPREAYTSVPSEPRDVDLSMRLDEETNIPLPQSPTLALEKVLEEIRNYMKMAATRANSPDDTLMSHQQLIVNEWHQLALIFDRLLFWCYVVVSVLVTIVMMSH